jgi:hypothetical protein
MSLYGSNYTKAFIAAPSEKVDVSHQHGRIRVSYDEIALSSVIALNEKVYLGRLPKGAKVVEAILAFPDLGATGVCDLGYEYDDAALVADPNAFLSAVDVNAAADTVKMSDQNNMVGFGVEMEGEASVILTATTATTAIAGTVKVAIHYVVD